MPEVGVWRHSSSAAVFGIARMAAGDDDFEFSSGIIPLGIS